MVRKSERLTRNNGKGKECDIDCISLDGKISPQME